MKTLRKIRRVAGERWVFLKSVGARVRQRVVLSVRDALGVRGDRG
jgi:hypothetical protein